MGDAARGDAGRPRDLTGRDPSTDRCAHRPVPGVASPFLGGDNPGQLCGCVGDLIELASLVRGRRALHARHPGAQSRRP